jgi:hypothetical protein
MRSRTLRLSTAALALLLGSLSVLFAPDRAAAQNGFSGQIAYTGALGPVSRQRPLCLCVFADAGLTSGITCLIFNSNPSSYQITRLAARNYYAIAFLDIEINERLDPGEPYQIYRERGMTPADPVVAGATTTGIDFLFGDENLPQPPTPEPTATLEPTPTATLEPTPTATSEPTPTVTLAPTVPPPNCPGDCDGDGAVSISEIVLAVGIALGFHALDECPAADLDGDGEVSIAEIVTAVNSALYGCGG